MTMLSGKVAVITGASSGIGLATATLLAEHGATTVLAGRDPERLHRARKTVPGKGIAVSADVSTLAGIDQLMTETGAAYGRIDVLFANAGTSQSPELADIDEKAYDHVMNVNVKGVFFTVVRALPLLSTGASVILTGSVAAGKGQPGDPLYSASKAAVRSLARTLALDESLVSKGIRVNVVSPGTIATPMTAQSDPQAAEDIDAYVTGAVPMRRWGQADEVAQAVLFLAGPHSSYTTGADLLVDGGLAQT
jgi:NAD(P)-dependent dehydrogenase (short-subunit alcohol dehydrogenase family)